MAYTKRQKKDDQTETKAKVEEQKVDAAASPEATASEREAALEKRIQELEAVASQKAAEEDPGPTRFGVRVKEGQVLRDPFSTQNPHQIRKHPPGKRLHWCNPAVRDRRGWRGWVPVRYDDEIGKNLGLYITDPPTRMEGVAGIDGYVRRGSDSILCVIDEEIWLSRQINREAKQRKRVDPHRKGGGDRVLRDGTVMIDGGGLEDSKRPPGGFRFRHEGSRGRSDLAPDVIDPNDPAIHN